MVWSDDDGFKNREVSMAVIGLAFRENESK
jgi:hypothetical protein